MFSEQMSALVTGGAKGLGRAICERLAADGWLVAVNDLDESAAAATCEAIEADGGRIVHIDSEVVTKTPAHRTAYVTAKSARRG